MALSTLMKRTFSSVSDFDSDSDEEIVLALCMHEIHSASVANVALGEKDLDPEVKAVLARYSGGSKRKAELLEEMVANEAVSLAAAEYQEWLKMYMTAAPQMKDEIEGHVQDSREAYNKAKNKRTRLSDSIQHASFSGSGSSTSLTPSPVPL